MSDSDDYENYDFYQRTTLEQQGQARGRNVQPDESADNSDYENVETYLEMTERRQAVQGNMRDLPGQRHGLTPEEAECSAVWMNPICPHILLLIVIFIWTVLIIVVFTKYSALTEEIQHLKESDSALMAEMQFLKENDSALTAEIQVLKENDSALTMEIKWLKANDSAQMAEIQFLKENDSALTAEIQVLKENDSALTMEIKWLKANDSAQMAEIQFLKENDSALTNNIQLLKANVSHVSSAVNKVESEISLLNNKNSALTKKIQWLKDYALACAAKLCDWAQINGTCYYLSKNSTDWSGAKQNCKALGSNLTIVYRTEELEHLSNIICWLTDIDLKGNKSWLNGTPVERNQMSSDSAKELDPHNGP